MNDAEVWVGRTRVAVNQLWAPTDPKQHGKTLRVDEIKSGQRVYFSVVSSADWVSNLDEEERQLHERYRPWNLPGGVVSAPLSFLDPDQEREFTLIQDVKYE